MRLFKEDVKSRQILGYLARSSELPRSYGWSFCFKLQEHSGVEYELFLKVSMMLVQKRELDEENKL